MSKRLVVVQGAWSEEDDGWVSEILTLQRNAWLEIKLPSKGRVVIKQAQIEADGEVWPMALISDWSGPLFKIRITHQDKSSSRQPVRLKVVTTEVPVEITIVEL